MIDYGEAILLGIIQGLSEFIPISSTAHLRIIPAFMDMKDPGAAYSAVIQLGTLISLLIYFRTDLWQFSISSLYGLRSGQPFKDQRARMLWYMILGTIPVSVFGLLLKDYIKGDFRSLYVIALSLIGLAVILYIVDLLTVKRKQAEQSTWLDWLLVGIGQSFALIPGASRSGTTLTVGLLLGYRREDAMRISFLLSIPAIALSGLYELYEERSHLAELGFGGLFAGTMTAFVFGYISIAFLLRYLKSHSTLVFVLYRIAMGVLILYLLSVGAVQPM